MNPLQSGIPAEDCGYMDTNRRAVELAEAIHARAQLAEDAALHKRDIEHNDHADRLDPDELRNWRTWGTMRGGS